MNILIILSLIILVVFAGISGFILGKKRGSKEQKETLLKEAEKDKSSALNQAKVIVNEAELKAKDMVLKAEIEIKEKIVNNREKLEKETAEKRSEFKSAENRLHQKEDLLNKKNEIMEKRINEIKDREKRFKMIEEALSDREKELKEAENIEISYLERLAGLSKEDAKSQLTEVLEKEAKFEFSLRMKKFEEEFLKTSHQKATDILATTIEKIAVEYINENTISVVELPNDDMKGRLIGREGRNIRAFETITGVDLIIDDTPDFVTISCFEPVRREIAKRILTKLISDGRIHPKRIEDMSEKITKEVEEDILKTGEETVYEMGFGNIHPEIIKLIGKLKYRTSYGQNALSHSKEVAYISGLIASEMRIDPADAKRAGLLHDIGKAIDREVEGNHQQIGADIAKKNGENNIVVNAIMAHHGDVPYESVEAAIVQVADAISASRPGARRETYQFYIKRVMMLEAIANAFIGVEKSFAIQAGREVRIIVNSQDISDDEAIILVKIITKKIEEYVKFPGTIKVIVIRETRVSEIAK